MARNRRQRGETPWGRGEQFIGLQSRFVRSNLVAGLSPFACKLLLDLLAAYNGRNNGDLCVTWSLMRPRGWRSKSTLAKAIRELVNRDVIELTRAGGRRIPSLYALTILKIDECRGKHDGKATERPPNTWLKHEPLTLVVARATAAAAPCHKAAA